MSIWPRPWTFDWDEVPRILAANGRVVCVLPTGNIRGPYDSEAVKDLARVLIGQQVAEDAQ